MEKQQDKQKLTVEGQVQDMKEKDIKFEICSEEDAKKFLQYNNYYFKLKSYARNYNMNSQTKKYFNLDFAYLVELSKLDMYIRKIILELSLDVEHYLKVRLMIQRKMVIILLLYFCSIILMQKWILKAKQINIPSVPTSRKNI